MHAKDNALNYNLLYGCKCVRVYDAEVVYKTFTEKKTSRLRIKRIPIPPNIRNLKQVNDLK